MLFKTIIHSNLFLHVQPPLISDPTTYNHQSKKPKFSFVKMLQIGPFCNQLLKVTATIFLGFRGFNNFPLVLTFCEWPLDKLSDLVV